MLENIAFKNLFYRFLENAIEAAKVLGFYTILRIYCKSSIKYLAIEDIAEDVVEDLS